MITESILIIGAGSNEYKLNAIGHIKDESEAERYGTTSELYRAYENAISFGRPDIYLMNMIYDNDYLLPDVVNSLVHGNYTYIVPINVKFFDKIYLENQDGFLYYPEYLLNTICSENNIPTIMMTDSHASLFEDIDSFIKTQERKLKRFKNTSVAAKRYGTNLCFIGNNLADYKFANVVAAAMLASSSLKDYPVYDCGDAVFDIDYHDIHCKEFCFFKYGVKRHATIENFYNFNTVDDQCKFVPISRVIKYLYRYLDLSEFCGSLYNTYKKVLIVDKLDTLLSKIVGTAISDYNIVSCNFARNKLTNEVIIINEIIITPINSLEKYKLAIEV